MTERILTRKERRQILRYLDRLIQADPIDPRGGWVSDGAVAAEAMIRTLPVSDEHIHMPDVTKALEDAGWELHGSSWNSLPMVYTKADRALIVCGSCGLLEWTRYCPDDLMDGLLAEFDRPAEPETPAEGVGAC